MQLLLLLPRQRDLLAVVYLFPTPGAVLLPGLPTNHHHPSFCVITNSTVKVEGCVEMVDTFFHQHIVSSSSSFVFVFSPQGARDQMVVVWMPVCFWTREKRINAIARTSNQPTLPCRHAKAGSSVAVGWDANTTGRPCKGSTRDRWC